MRVFKLLLLLPLALLLAATTSLAQSPAAEETLTKFNLNFPGGTPAELVRAIEQAMGKPLNLIVQPNDANLRLPELHMTGIDAAQLFDAMSEGSLHVRLANNLLVQTRYAIRTRGKPTDASVWYLFVESGHPLQEKSTRFYLLTPYLEQGLSVDDITTAIQTAWRMRGAEDAPAISYHEETNLLIAVGEGAGLQTIEHALTALRERSRPRADAEAANQGQTKSGRN